MHKLEQSQKRLDQMLGDGWKIKHQLPSTALLEAFEDFWMVPVVDVFLDMHVRNLSARLHVGPFR